MNCNAQQETDACSEALSPSMPPNWLLDITPENFQHMRFPLTDILRDSLYYPSCGIDGTPVKYLGGSLHSFIYVDYGTTREQLMDALSRRGFYGYRLIGDRAVDQNSLTPNGWYPKFPKAEEGDPNRFQRNVVNHRKI